jgi:hypothetical protein
MYNPEHFSAFIPRQNLDRVAAAKVDSHAKHATRNVWNSLELRPLCAGSGMKMRQLSGGQSDHRRGVIV